jgi:RNA polymerase sigma-70 factor, ECF subfamily
MSDLTDRKLLQTWLQGDTSAFRTLVRRHDKYLYRIARSIILDDHDAEDVVQETFIRAFTGLRSFRGSASFRTWLTRIVLNEASRRRRHQRSIVNLDALHAAQGRRRSSPSSSLITPELDPESSAAQSQIRRLLEKAIDDLPAAFRIVVIMRDVEEVGTQETASLLGIREETVKTRLHRGRRMLRESLGEQVASALRDVFPFNKPRCNALVQRLLDHIGLSGAERPP